MNHEQLSPKPTKLVNQVKLWLFPAIVTLLAGIIYKEVLEIRSDVKQLLAQSNIDKTKIEQLENQVEMLNNAVFLKGKPISKVFYPNNTEFLYAKHEEVYHLPIEEKHEN